MKPVYKLLEKYFDNYSLKKKLLVFYLFCLLLPLLITDAIILNIIMTGESTAQRYEMNDTANTVKYTLTSILENGIEIADRIYTSRYVDDFLSGEYESEYAYLIRYQNFFKDTFFDSRLIINHMQIAMYTDNESIIHGGRVKKISNIKNTPIYKDFKSKNVPREFYFDYDESGIPELNTGKKLLLFYRMDFFKGTGSKEKILFLKFDYSNLVRSMEKLNHDMDVYICHEGRIVLANKKHISLAGPYEEFVDFQNIGYEGELNIDGMRLKIYVMKPESDIKEGLLRNLPIFLLLLLINAVLPLILAKGINRSFTSKISQLSVAFESVNQPNLVEIEPISGRDEISNLVKNYNKMARRTNNLIQIVYKNKINEQEITVAKKNAELLALQSQINPHFLFNALESIRMHSLLKQESETSLMVEKLAFLQRQYVEWEHDSIEIEKEINFVEAYLCLQKYRFGSRLNYSIDIEENCKSYTLPKLSIVTFVENACVHGIESRVQGGWIFVRIYERKNQLCIEIEDTGEGMEEEVRSSLEERMNHASIEMLKGGGRIGMINACLRLKLALKEDIQFMLESEKNIGTTVYITISCNV